MRNLPTDLLRALVTVLEAESFTRAGERLGRSQSAVSLQIKRLEEMIGLPLLEREAGGPPRATEAGREAATYARRILALNDEMVERMSREAVRPRLRLGLPNDYADAHLAAILDAIGREGRDAVRLEIDCDLSVHLVRRLRDGELDLVVAQGAGAPGEVADGARRWREPLAWVGAPAAAAARDGVVRLLAYPEGCNYRREMLAALSRAGRAHEIVCVSQSLPSLEAMLRAGFGVTALSRRGLPAGFAALGEESGLPALEDVTVGVLVREGLGGGAAGRLAGRLAALLAARLGGAVA